MNLNFTINDLAWEKMGGTIPAIVQDFNSQQILMLGYMNMAALKQTLETQWVTFFSRSRNALWVKGEISGNRLSLCGITTDCDKDTLLVYAKPTGPTCHEGTTTCFQQDQPFNVINRL